MILLYSIAGRMIAGWFLMALAGLCVCFMCWYFSCALCKKKPARVIITLLLVGGMVLWYVLDHRPPKVVKMKEDVLYVKPISDTKTL